MYRGQKEGGFTLPWAYLQRRLRDRVHAFTYFLDNLSPLGPFILPEDPITRLHTPLTTPAELEFLYRINRTSGTRKPRFSFSRHLLLRLFYFFRPPGFSVQILACVFFLLPSLVSGSEGLHEEIRFSLFSIQSFEFL